WWYVTIDAMNAKISELNMVRPTTFEILIIGGGVIGSSIAYYVARQGRKVLVVERQEIATEPAASWASAGGIRPQGLHPAEENLARIALALWPGLSEELEADLYYRNYGHLLLAENDIEAEQLLQMVQHQHKAGFAEVALLDRQALASLAPGLGEQIEAGSFSPISGHADPRRTTRAFAAAAQRHGAHYWTGTTCLALHRKANRVIGAQTERGNVQAEHIVLASGAWSRDLAHSIGLELPLRMCVLQALLSTPAPPETLLPVLSTVKGTLSLKQQPDGAFVLGGGWPGDPTPDGRSYTLRPESQQKNWALACEVFPLLHKLQRARAWGGLQAHSIDDRPFIGSLSEFPGLTLALGSWYGFALAPAIGSAVAGHLAGLPTPELAQLTPERITLLSSAQITAFLTGAAPASAQE
ncbi:MAG TPA: FAD-binding oxidoreductase, partial [Ktedonobacteraceae bacterium]|nr:FAD-binding oxidoreductase [Ktedonobacteraceae bacterium]